LFATLGFLAIGILAVLIAIVNDNGNMNGTHFGNLLSRFPDHSPNGVTPKESRWEGCFCLTRSNIALLFERQVRNGQL
jgi:hypothetical protein